MPGHLCQLPPALPASGLLLTDRPSHPTPHTWGDQHMGLALARSRETERARLPGRQHACPSGRLRELRLVPLQPGRLADFLLSAPKSPPSGSTPEATHLFPPFPLRAIPDKPHPPALWVPERSCHGASLSHPTLQLLLQNHRECPRAVRHVRKQAHDSSDEDGRQ